ncbi:MAG: carbamate kinase, partial [Candidatus Polarisedimenticolia bacterium]
MPKRRTAVVAFGGNALIKKDQEGTQWEQWENARETAQALLPVLRHGSGLVVVHGNGPQVGNILIQVEEGITKVPPISLDVCVAASEGSIGYMLEVALLNELRREKIRRGVLTLVSEVVVDPEDPGFRRPTKPIGPFYPKFRAEDLMRKQGWNMIEDAGRGWRKVVPSPRPLEVLQIEAIRQAAARGHVVIAGGGGGVPVYRTPGGDLRGVEAVIDKDYTAALIARRLRADLFVILTGVEQVSLDFGRPGERPLATLSAGEAKGHQAAGQFPEGSMGPKIRAAVEFVEAGGREVLITSAPRLADAVRGRAGTRITRDADGRRRGPSRRAAAPARNAA